MLEKDIDILRGVLDAMQDMFRVLDLNQSVILTNKSYQDCFGDQLGAACNEMFGLSHCCAKCISKLALETGQPQKKHRRFQKVIYLMTASPLYDSKNNAIGTVEVFSDITDQYLQQDALRVQNKRLLREAGLAAQMQRDLFLAQGQPDSRVRMDSRYLPASSMGGDMFGCLRQNDDRTSFYIADVSGHGMAAAMITLLLANVMRGTQARSAVQLLYRAREAFLSMVKDDQLYVSMFVALLDPETGRLSWANAGLNAIPLLVNGEVMERLYAPALPVCNWEDEIIYRERRNTMQIGGRLLLYTDGLLDDKSSALTEEELEKCMLEHEGDALLKTLQKKVKSDHDDDVCMLLITRVGEEMTEEQQ